MEYEKGKTGKMTVDEGNEAPEQKQNKIERGCCYMRLRRRGEKRSMSELELLCQQPLALT